MKKEHDSNDELYFSWYCEELKEFGIIYDFTRGNSYELNKTLKIEYKEIKVLKTKTKIVDKIQTLIPTKIYTPDFEIIWNRGENSRKFVQVLKESIQITKPFICQLLEGIFTSIIEIKPQFDQNNMTRLFKTNQAIMWDKKIYVNLIGYEELFENTFTPKKFILNPNQIYSNNTKFGKKGDSKIKWKIRTLKEYLDGNTTN